MAWVKRVIAGRNYCWFADGAMLDLKARRAKVSSPFDRRDNTHITRSIRFLLRGENWRSCVAGYPGSGGLCGAYRDSLAAFITSLGEVPACLNALMCARYTHGEAKPRQRRRKRWNGWLTDVARVADFAGAIFVSVTCRTAAAPSEPETRYGIAIQRIGYHLWWPDVLRRAHQIRARRSAPGDSAAPETPF